MHAAIVFPGQGSQFAGMADVWITNDAAREVLDDATEAIGRDIVAGCRDEEALTTTEFVQPALLACDVAAFRVLDALGVTFVGAAGHSLGEFADWRPPRWWISQMRCASWPCAAGRCRPQVTPGRAR